MRRPALLTIAALGGLVCLIAGTGMFAALTDTARTGTNSVESRALAASADIQLATATQSGSTFTCGTFEEDLSSAFITVTDAAPGSEGREADGSGKFSQRFCIKSVGSQQVELSVQADALTDVDFACTGDESLHGDATCGADQVGELSSVLLLVYAKLGCETGGGTLTQALLADSATTPVALGTLDSGAVRCFTMDLRYPSTTPIAAVQKAQSDRATWKFKFNAQS